jgi:hypothetical protein
MKLPVTVAATLLALPALPALAASGLQPYQYETEVLGPPSPSHRDCIPQRVGPASAPPFRVYRSHVEWRDDERGCGVHPITMGPRTPSYSFTGLPLAQTRSSVG